MGLLTTPEMLAANSIEGYSESTMSSSELSLALGEGTHLAKEYEILGERLGKQLAIITTDDIVDGMRWSGMTPNEQFDLLRSMQATVVESIPAVEDAVHTVNKVRAVWREIQALLRTLEQDRNAIESIRRDVRIHPTDTCLFRATTSEGSISTEGEYIYVFADSLTKAMDLLQQSLDSCSDEPGDETILSIEFVCSPSALVGKTNKGNASARAPMTDEEIRNRKKKTRDAYTRSCPTCKVPAGRYCVTSSGAARGRGSYHKTRSKLD